MAPPVRRGVDRAKPEPEVYRRCVAACRAEPETTLFVDDSRANIAGAETKAQDPQVADGLSSESASWMLNRRSNGPKCSAPLAEMFEQCDRAGQVAAPLPQQLLAADSIDGYCRQKVTQAA